ncbi:MAG: DNA circularization N-terminal domain-containing protein [Alphaproteobacteria bacterium]|nr:MAG: DNA circularization N-terminal domain-containing protein [Alphaproteobacteria bacterium]
MRPASFRGVPFHVDGDDLVAGRRTVVHEYPQRDKPYAEDMGRATREISFYGFVIGPDYMLARDALLSALETEGPGQLIHPYYGTVQVSVLRCRVSHSRAEGGMARFDLSFSEAGELVFPSSQLATDRHVQLRATAALGALAAWFSSAFTLAGMAEWATVAAQSNLDGVLDAARGLVTDADATGQWVRMVDEQAPTAITQTPSSLADQMIAALTPPESIWPSANSVDAFSSMVSWAASGHSALAAPTSTGAIDPMGVQAGTNAAALRALARGALLVQGADQASRMPVTVYQDAMSARRILTRGIDAEILATTDDGLLNAWSDLRAALHRDLTVRAKNAARLVTVTPRTTLPALAVAYNLYEDTGRTSEIVARNKIRHPSFVPPEPLLALNR